MCDERDCEGLHCRNGEGEFIHSCTSDLEDMPCDKGISCGDRDGNRTNECKSECCDRNGMCSCARDDEVKRRRRKSVEFSKRTLAAMTVLWFIGAALGGFTVLWQLFGDAYTVQLDSLLGYIGMPMTGGIVGYMVKSALENREKIRGYTDERDIV